MSILNFDAKQCERIRRQLDAYLNNELLVETTGDVLRHLVGCPACSQELEARTRVRDALRRAVASQAPPPELQASIARELRKMQPGFGEGFLQPRMVAALAGAVVIIVAIVAGGQWIRVARGRRMVAGVIAIGVADHVQCAIKGHNYPDTPSPPEQLRQKLGPQYAGLLEVVQQKLPGFEVLEAHICSIPGSPRKYVHFITRGRGTILSVILTRREGEQLPRGTTFSAGTAARVNLYEAHLDDMNAAAFQSQEYWGFVVSDLGRDSILEIAGELAPPLQAALDAGSNRSAGLIGIPTPFGIL